MNYYRKTSAFAAGLLIALSSSVPTFTAFAEEADEDFVMTDENGEDYVMIDDDGNVSICGTDQAMMEKAVELIELHQVG